MPSPAAERERFLQALLGDAADVEPLTLEERYRKKAEWREVYARAYRQPNGRYRLGAHDWHVFSDGGARCRKDRAAFRAYGQVCDEDRESIVIVDDAAGPCFKCRRPPRVEVLSGLPPGLLDVYVFPVDRSWTFVMTHEEWMYFAWQHEQQPPEPTGRPKNRRRS